MRGSAEELSLHFFYFYPPRRHPQREDVRRTKDPTAESASRCPLDTNWLRLVPRLGLLLLLRVGVGVDPAGGGTSRCYVITYVSLGLWPIKGHWSGRSGEYPEDSFTFNHWWNVRARLFMVADSCQAIQMSYKGWNSRYQVSWLSKAWWSIFLCATYLLLSQKAICIELHPVSTTDLGCSWFLYNRFNIPFPKTKHNSFP